MFKSKEELLMAVNKCLPYHENISELDFSTYELSIMLTWRNRHKFVIGINGTVYELENGVPTGTDISIMFRELLKRQYVSSIL